MCFEFLYNLSLKLLTILRRNELDMIILVYLFSCKITLFLSDFHATGILSTDFQKILKYQIS